MKNKIINDKCDEKKIHVINHGVDTNLFKPNQELNSRFSLKLNVSDDDFIIGYIGTLSIYEGIDYILKCVRLLLNEEQKRNIKFVIIGDGIYKNEMLETIKNLRINDNVLYLGKIDYRNVIKYYNIFDLVIYPRKRCELCNTTPSYKILEAMSMEKPIIASELNATKEIIIDEFNGLLCKPDNIEDLLQKINLLIQNPELRNKLGKNAREWVNNNREWTKIGTELITLYDSLL